MSRQHSNNDWYEELCALAAIGETSPSEFEELQLHLDECSDCRELYADFRRIASKDLGTVAVLKHVGRLDQADNTFDENEVLSRLLARASSKGVAVSPSLDRQRQPVEVSTVNQKGTDISCQPMLWLRQPALCYSSLVVILCAAVAVSTYRLSSQVETWKTRARTAEAQERTTSESLRQAASARNSLQKSLAHARAIIIEASAKYQRSRAEEESLESQLAAQRAQVELQAQQLQAANGAMQDKNKKIAELEARVQLAASRTEEQREIAERIKRELKSAQQRASELASRMPEAQGFKDSNVKELFGARDLHIVDVYDVDSNGRTKRTHGRVYYVEKKLLIFYAFDLQDKENNRVAAGFQAWGYRETSDRKPENLGLFSLDDGPAHRWVLQVDNPRVLARIDAVYVTLEPTDGSPSPRGRRLLYASLLSPPNHP